MSKLAQAVLDQPTIVTFVQANSSDALENPLLVSMNGFTAQDSLTFLNYSLQYEYNAGDTLSGTINLTVRESRNKHKISGNIALYGLTIGKCSHANLLSFQCNVKSTKDGLKFSVTFQSLKFHQINSTIYRLKTK